MPVTDVVTYFGWPNPPLLCLSKPHKPLLWKQKSLTELLSARWVITIKRQRRKRVSQLLVQRFAAVVQSVD